jgi:hypothetical protein
MPGYIGNWFEGRRDWLGVGYYKGSGKVEKVGYWELSVSNGFTVNYSKDGCIEFYGDEG